MRNGVELRYYRVMKGHGYWCPTPKMRAMGFENVRCGPDGEAARNIAKGWNQRWQEVRKRPTTTHSDKGFVYFLLSDNRVKIGFTNAGVSRLAGLTTGMSAKVDSFLLLPGTRSDEKRLHQRFTPYRQQGEWFAAARPIRLTMMRSAMAGYLVHDRQRPVQTEQISAES